MIFFAATTTTPTPTTTTTPTPTTTTVEGGFCNQIIMICYQFDTINDIWFCCFDLKLQRWGWSEDRDLTRETSLLVDDLSVTIITTRKMPVWFAGLLKRQETLNVSFLFLSFVPKYKEKFSQDAGVLWWAAHHEFTVWTSLYRLQDGRCAVHGQRSVPPWLPS